MTTATGSPRKRLDSVETVEFLAARFTEQANLLENLPGSYSSDRLNKAMFMPWSISETAKAMSVLARSNFGNEIYIILRALIEKIITFYYLQACSEEEFENYVKYSQQKTIWKMNQSLGAGEKRFELRITDDFDLDKFPELQAAKQQFTSSKGKPITRWSPTSIEKKLETIEEQNIVDTSLLLIATSSFYDDGSEALHATMYGCVFHLGVFRPEILAKTSETLVNRHHANLSTIFFVMSLVLGQLAKWISEAENLRDVSRDAKTILKESKNYMNDVLDHNIQDS